MHRIGQSASPGRFPAGSFREENDNRRLREHMHILWKDPAEYKVFMTERMMNLNDALMREWDVKENGQYLTDRIMSDTAFLLSARTVADRYAYKKCFPRILICDDIILHGRNIIRLLNNFLRIISRHLAKSSLRVDERRLKEDLYHSIGICIFAGNKDRDLLIDENRFRLYLSVILPTGRLRELSLQISDYLRNRGIPNTSCVLSVNLTQDSVQKILTAGKDMHPQPFRYQGRKQDLFFRARSSRILETVRLNSPNGNFGYSGVLTGLTLFGDIPGDAFDALCISVAQFMEQNVRYSQISAYLRMEDPELDASRARLLSFLYSVLSLAEFCRQYLNTDRNELYKILVSGDFDKIISNFDKGTTFRYEIFSLFRAVCIDASTASVLWDFLNCAASDLIPGQEKTARFAGDGCGFRYIEGPAVGERRKLYENAEDIFYEIGMDSEYDAHRYSRTGIPFDADRAGFDTLSFRQYMRIMQQKKNTPEHSIGCVFGLIDSGSVSFNIEAMAGRDRNTVRTVLKAGNLATYLLPQRFAVFIPALDIVENSCQETGKYARDVVSAFADYLKDYCYKNGSHQDSEDEKLLESFQKKKALLLYMYAAGQRFHDWNIDFKNERTHRTDRPATEKDGFTVEEETARKNHYSRVAERFLD